MPIAWNRIYARFRKLTFVEANLLLSELVEKCQLEKPELLILYNLNSLVSKIMSKEAFKYYRSSGREERLLLFTAYIGVENHLQDFEYVNCLLWKTVIISHLNIALPLNWFSAWCYSNVEKREEERDGRAEGRLAGEAVCFPLCIHWKPQKAVGAWILD